MKMFLRCKTLKKSKGCSLALVLPVLALLSQGTGSQAALMSRNVNVTLDASNQDSYNLDVNLDGTNDFTIQTAYVPDPALTVGFDQFVFPFGGTNAVVIDQQTGDGFPPVSLLSAGSVVSPSSLFSSGNDTGDLFFTDTIDPDTGNFNGKTGFVGLRFTGSGGTFYGLAQITVDSLTASSTPLNLTIGQVIYNNVAGQPITVPEPASAGMATVGLFALVSARRKR